MQTWTLQPIASPTLLVVAGLALFLLLWLGPSFAKLTTRRRIVLSLLRASVIGMALMATLRPGCVQKVQRSQSATLLFLADTSRSMELPHRDDDSSRFETLKDMLAQNQSLISRLKEQQIEFKFLGFDSQSHELDLNNGIVQLPDRPTGAETDIGSSIFSAALDARKERIVGVFVASDGVQNSLDPKIELNKSAEILDDMSVPLFAIPFGLPGENGQVADVAVMSLPEQHRIAVNNQLNVEATVSARGYTNRPVMVQLFVTDQDGNEYSEPPIQFVPDKAYVEKKVVLSHVPSQPGQYRLRVKAIPDGNELATRNNELPSFLNVYDGGLRVLYLDGGIGWEQRFIRDAIATSAQGIELVPITIYSDEASRKGWPLGGEITDWFRDPSIEVIIFGDVDASALFDPKLQAENFQLLIEAIDQGKGFMMLGGPHSFGPGGYHSTPLDDILPIRMNLDERQDFPPATLRKDLHINNPIKLLPTKDHFITRISADDDFRAAWQKLPPLVGANRFVGVKDNAEILLQSESGNPILVAGRLGGRVLAFAGDSTWRWVMQDNEDEFKRFWRQTLLWLAAQDGREKNSVWIDMPQRRFQPGAYISFDCLASDSTGSLIDDVDFNATLVSPNGIETKIAIDAASGKGEFRQGELELPGVYQIYLAGSRDGRELGDSKFEFVVFDRDREKAVAAADVEQMASLAAQTKEHGGKLILPEDFGEVLQELNDHPPETIEVPLKWQLGQTLADGAAYLMLFTLLLGIEWWLRKKWGLV